MKKIFIYRKQVYILDATQSYNKLSKNFKLKENNVLNHSIIQKNEFFKLKSSLINFKKYLTINTNSKNYLKMLKYLEYLITNKLLDKKIIFKKIFKEKDLKQKNDRVFYSKSKNVYPDNQLIWLIYLYAKVNNILICRLCLHKSDKNKINSMIMIHVTNQIVGPLKQHKKYIAYHIIFGYIQIILNQKSKKNIFNLKSNGDNKNLLIPANEFRSIKSLSSPSIFLEIAEGPFKDSDTIWKT